jgi:hypothetical protein
MNETDNALPPKLAELMDELDQEVRSIPTARALSRRGVSAQLVIHAVEGLNKLLDGDGDQALRLFEAIVEEIRDRTVASD